MNGFIKLTTENGEKALVNIALVQYVRQGKRFANVALQGKSDMLVEESAHDIGNMINASYTGAIIEEEAKPETIQVAEVDASPKSGKGKGK